MTLPRSVRRVRRRFRGFVRSGRLAVRSLHGEHRLFLTFDGGPDYRLADIVRVLDEYDAKATFFVVGQSVTSATIPLLASALEDGHTIGSLTWSNADISTCTPEEIVDEVQNAGAALTRVYEEAGRDPSASPRLFRFPRGHEGDHTQRRAAYRTLAGLGYAVCGYDLDVGTAEIAAGPFPFVGSEEPIFAARPGDTIRLAECRSSPEYLERVLPALAARFDLCSLEEGNAWGRARRRLAAAA